MVHLADQFGRSSSYTNKIIVISDGRPTEDDLIAGPDIEDSIKIDEVIVVIKFSK